MHLSQRSLQGNAGTVAGAWSMLNRIRLSTNSKPLLEIGFQKAWSRQFSAVTKLGITPAIVSGSVVKTECWEGKAH